MAFESVPPVLGKISQLLVQAGKAKDPKQRAKIIKELWTIRAKLKAELKQAEEDIRAGTNRRVEAVVYRSAISTLEVELSLLGEEEPPESP